MSTEVQPTIYAALAEVMAAVGHVGKGERNPQGGYNFRGIDAVVNAVGPALRANKVIVVPQISDYIYGEILVGKNRTPMGHARVMVNYTFYGPRGDSIVCSTPGEAFDSGDKATPKAMSVAFRTALLQALALPTDEQDVDASNYTRADRPIDNSGYGADAYAGGVDQATGEVRMIDKGQLIELKSLESKRRDGKAETEQQREGRLNWYAWLLGRPVASAKDLTQREADHVIEEMRKRVPAEPHTEKE